MAFTSSTDICVSNRITSLKKKLEQFAKDDQFRRYAIKLAA